jgi:hypothetical protein
LVCKAAKWFYAETLDGDPTDRTYRQTANVTTSGPTA